MVSFDRQTLKPLERLRNGNAWTDEERRLQEFWRQWEESELDRIGENERQRLLAKVVASRDSENVALAEGRTRWCGCSRTS